MQKKFADLEHPLITASIRRHTEDEAISDIKASERDGARSFILHIQLLEKQYRTPDTFRRIAASTEHPIMAIYYRGDGSSDNERLDVQADAIRSGFRSVDLPVYLFDNNSSESLRGCTLPFAAANPKEITMESGAVLRQKETVNRFKALGAEVLISVHTGVELNCEQSVSLAQEIELRGADIVKIVADCNSKEHALEVLAANSTMERTLKKPFLYICGGPYARFLRFNAPLFGSMLVFGHHDYHPLANTMKPLISDLVSYYRKYKSE